MADEDGVNDGVDNVEPDDDFGVGLLEDGTVDEDDSSVGEGAGDADGSVTDEGEQQGGDKDEGGSSLTREDVMGIVRDAFNQYAPATQQAASEQEFEDDGDEPVTRAELRQQQQVNASQAYVAKVQSEILAEENRLAGEILDDDERYAVRQLTVFNLQANPNATTASAYKKALGLLTGRDKRAVQRFVTQNKKKAAKTKGEATGSSSPVKPGSSAALKDVDWDDNNSVLRAAEKMMQQENKRRKRA